MSTPLLSRRHAISLTLAGVAGLVAPATAKNAGPARSIDRLAGEAIRNGDTPGLQVAIHKGGRQLLLGSYGIANIEFSAPVRTDTPFRIASLTKQFTAATMLRLQEEGKLSLDDRLGKYYPSFPRSNEVTLSRMINHTSGIHNYLKRPDWLADVMIRRDADISAAYFATMPEVYDFDPGTRFEYSNSAYIMLGGVIEKASGQSLDEAFRTRIFDPLGMAHTAVDDERLIVRGRASGYEKSEGSDFIPAGFLSVLATGAAGSLRSTAADLLKWQLGLFGGKVISRDSLKTMLEPGRLANGDYAPNAPPAKASARSGYGYGIAISESNGRLRFSHSGGIHGFGSTMSHFPDDDLTIILLSNCENRSGRWYDLVKRIVAVLV